jgi:hypothetical protein
LFNENPPLVSWHDERHETLLSSTMPYVLDVSDPERERLDTAPAAAEMLIDAGVTRDRSTWKPPIGAGAAGMLRLLPRKEVLQPALAVLAVLGGDAALRSQREGWQDGGDMEGADDGGAGWLATAGMATHRASFG